MARRGRGAARGGFEPDSSSGRYWYARFVNRVSVAEQKKSGKGAVDAESLQHHYYVALMVPGGEAKRQCVLPAVLYSGPSISIIGEAGLHRRVHHFEGLQKQAVLPYEGNPR